MTTMRSYAKIARNVRDVVEADGLNCEGSNLGELSTVIGHLHGSCTTWCELEAGSTVRTDRACASFLNEIGEAQDRSKDALVRKRLTLRHPRLVECLVRYPVGKPTSADQAQAIQRSPRNPLERLVTDKRLQRVLRDQFGISPQARGGRTGKSPETTYVKILGVIQEAFGARYKLESIARALSHGRSGWRRNGTGQNVQRKHKTPSGPWRHLDG